jgi:hypothetical protein
MNKEGNSKQSLGVMHQQRGKVQALPIKQLMMPKVAGRTSRVTRQTTRKKQEYQRDTSRGTIKQRKEEVKRGQISRDRSEQIHQADCFVNLPAL